MVNEDAGVEKQGKYVNYGDQVVEGLKLEGSFYRRDIGKRAEDGEISI